MIKRKRSYPYFDSKSGRYKVTEVVYEIYHKDGKLVDIRNEYGFSVEKNSEVWEYFERMKI